MAVSGKDRYKYWLRGLTRAELDDEVVSLERVLRFRPLTGGQRRQFEYYRRLTEREMVRRLEM